jgi:hypothetical protein
MSCGCCGLGVERRVRLSIPPGIKAGSQTRSSYAMNGEESVPFAVAPVSMLFGALLGIGVMWWVLRDKHGS